MKFNFDDNIFSDLVKEVYGTRSPAREYGHLSHYYNETPENKQKIWDELCEELEANNLVEQEQTIKAVARFEARIADVIELGAGNRTNALRWMSQQETFYHAQDVEHFVWELGILFTDYGRRLVKDLAAVVEYKDMEWV